MTASRYLIASLLCLFALAAESAPTTKVPPIYNVVELTTQDCSGPVSVLWTVHPDRTDIQHSGLLPLGDLGYQVNFSRIAVYRDWTAATRLHDRSRQVDDSYVLFNENGFGPFNAAYVITRLPMDIPDRDHALQVVMEMQQTNAGPGKSSFIRAETPFGPGLEMVVGGRVGSMCFPTSRFQYAGHQHAASIGISHFVVRGRDLIEYALTLPWPEGASQEEAIKVAQSRMSVFERGLEAVTH